MAEETTGKGKHLGGKVKEGLGDLLGDTELERDGKLDQVEGRAEQDQARAEEDAVEAARRKAAARDARKNDI